MRKETLWCAAVTWKKNVVSDFDCISLLSCIIYLMISLVWETPEIHLKSSKHSLYTNTPQVFGLALLADQWGVLLQRRTFVFQRAESDFEVGFKICCPGWLMVDREVWLKLAEQSSAEKVSVMPAACHMLSSGWTWCQQGRGGRQRANSGDAKCFQNFSIKESYQNR